MTQKEAIIKSLQLLGGRAELQYIYPLAIEIGDFSGSQDKRATIRNCLQMSPKYFRHSLGKPDGWWELVSYHDEIALRDKRIEELEKENADLKAVKTEDDFVKKLVTETMNLYKHEKSKTEVIRQILYKVGRSDAEAILDAWIEEKKIRPSVHFEGDYVANKHVTNEVNNVASGATGINVSGRLN